MKPSDTDTALSRMLAGLPAPKAPRTLLPRVMAAVRREQRKTWYLHPWSSWPRRHQIASLAVSVALAWILSSAWSRGVPGDSAEAIGAARVLWQVLVGPAAVYLAALAGAMGAASLVFCAALSRILQEGSSK